MECSGRRYAREARSLSWINNNRSIEWNVEASNGMEWTEGMRGREYTAVRRAGGISNRWWRANYGAERELRSCASSSSMRADPLLPPPIDSPMFHESFCCSRWCLWCLWWGRWWCTQDVCAPVLESSRTSKNAECRRMRRRRRRSRRGLYSGIVCCGAVELWNCRAGASASQPVITRAIRRAPRRRFRFIDLRDDKSSGLPQRQYAEPPASLPLPPAAAASLESRARRVSALLFCSLCLFLVSSSTLFLPRTF